MSRIRSIHPGLWTDERFVSAAPMARLLFMGILNECDDFGSFEWSPLKLKMRLLPADTADATALLDELVQAGSLLRYEVAGKAYGAVRNFCQYQRPKKPTAVHPQTDEIRKWVNINARSTRDGSEPVGKQFRTEPEKPRQMEDEGGREKAEAIASGKKTDPRGTRLPSDWSPSPLSGKTAEMVAAWPVGMLERELSKFRDHFAKTPGARGRSLDWNASLRNWLRNADERIPIDGRSNTLGRHQPADGLSSTARAAIEVFGR